MSGRRAALPRAPFTLVVGGTRSDRERTVLGLAAGLDADAALEVDTSASLWPFERAPGSLAAAASGSAAAGGPRTRVVWVRDLARAFPAGQHGGTRLILTQSSYHVQRWLDWLRGRPGTYVVAEAGRSALERGAPEAFARRGPWSRIALVDAAAPHDAASAAPRQLPEAATVDAPGLHDAFEQPDPLLRLERSAAAAALAPTNPALLLALASAQMEVGAVEDALDTNDRALALAPDWEAVHFERGKIWLRIDDAGRAAEAFAAAADLMPALAAAASNLGAALAELDRPDDALAALRRALVHDPYAHTTINNIGVVLRDRGQLEQAEAAFRQAIALAPRFVFGRYNLAHTLFLERRFADAVGTYERAFDLDAQQSPRQRCRLALALAASGRPDEAIDTMHQAVVRLGEPAAAEALSEADETLEALLALPEAQVAALSRVREAVRAIPRR